MKKLIAILLSIVALASCGDVDSYAVEIYRGIVISVAEDCGMSLNYYDEAKVGIDRTLDHLGLVKLPWNPNMHMYGPSMGYAYCGNNNVEGCWNGKPLIACENVHPLVPKTYDKDGILVLNTRVVSSHELIREWCAITGDGPDGKCFNKLSKEVVLSP